MKLIACDLDGTILDDHKQPDPYLKDVLQKLRERDIGFTIVSGRNEEIMDHYVDYFECSLPYITNNGGNIYQEHRCLLNDCSPVSYNNDFLKTLYTHHIPFRAYAVEGFYANSTSPFFEERMAPVAHLMIPFDPLADQSKYSFYKITSDFSFHPDYLPEFTEKVERDFPEMTFLKAENYIYCANSKTATNGQALKRVCDMIGVDMKDVMAFGDNGNDMSMLETAGISVAVGNASKDIKEACDCVCGDNNHAGVSAFLQEYFHL